MAVLHPASGTDMIFIIVVALAVARRLTGKCLGKSRGGDGDHELQKLTKAPVT